MLARGRWGGTLTEAGAHPVLTSAYSTRLVFRGSDAEFLKVRVQICGILIDPIRACSFQFRAAGTSAEQTNAQRLGAASRKQIPRKSPTPTGRPAKA